jgi:hypothetical protein
MCKRRKTIGEGGKSSAIEAVDSRHAKRWNNGSRKSATVSCSCLLSIEDSHTLPPSERAEPNVQHVSILHYFSVKDIFYMCQI